MSLLLSGVGKPDARTPAFLRFREVAGNVVVTSLDGSFAVLSPDELRELARGQVARGTPLYDRLREANLVQAELDARRMTDRLRARYAFLHAGPSLHTLTVTRRSNETRTHGVTPAAGASAIHTDMTPEIAEKAVDLALSTTSPRCTIELAGGEPLLAWPVVQHVVDYAKKKNESIGKALGFVLVSNLSLMDDAKLAWIADNAVRARTHVDGPRSLHDELHELAGMSAYEQAATWMRRIDEAHGKAGRDLDTYGTEALVTVTRETLPLWKELVDAYVELGRRAITLQPMRPAPYSAGQTREPYPRAEWLAFYRSAVDYMIALSHKGVGIAERHAVLFATKILSGTDPGVLDVRSPGGAGLATLAYDWDGRVFSSDEGRLLHERGDDTFLVGDVRTSRYREVVGHETVRAEAIASLRVAQPDCVDCAYNPYCGVPAAYTYATQGNLWGRMRENELCGVLKGIQDYLFEKIVGNDVATMEVLRRWATPAADPGAEAR